MVAQANQPEIYSSRIWQARDGLPQDAIQAIAQTADGYLWIGTSGGLIRFDGVRFVSFTRDNTAGFQDDSVLSLRVTSDGSLWVGTEGGGLLRYRDGIFRRFGSESGLINLFVRAIYQDRRSNLWVGTDAGVFRLQDDRFIRIDDKPPSIPAMNVYTICEDERGRVLVGGLGLLIWDNGKTTAYASRAKAADWMVNTVQSTSDGALWIGTFAHLRRVPRLHSGDPFRDEFRVEVLAGEQRSPSGPSGRYHISAITQTRDGNIWIGTWGQGLILMRNGELRRFRAPAFLPDDNVYAVVEDKEGNLWVGTQNGLVRLNRRLATTVTVADGHPVNIRAVYADARRKLWMVSTAGQLFELQGDNLVRAAVPPALEGIPLRTLFRDRAGALWIGTDGQGIFRWSQLGVSRYGESRAPEFAPMARAPYFPRAFCEDTAGNLWVGDDSGLSRFRDGLFTWIADVPHSVRSVIASRGGDLWVGTDTGVYHLVNGKVVSEPALEPLRREKVWAIHEDATGKVWFGTRGAGGFLLHENRLTRFSIANGLPSNSIFSILEDETGNLWMSSPNGVFSVRRGDLERVLADPNYHPPVQLYGTSEGLSTKQMSGGVQPSGVLSSESELWFPSSGGAVRIHPGTLHAPDILPVVIEQVLANGREVPLAGGLRLGPATRDLEIHYTAVRLQSPERVRFRYQLEGFDDHWNEAGERRVAYYTNLPAGDYRFRLVAYDVNVPDQPAEANVRIRLDPQFYRTPWFLGLCVLAAGAVAALGYVVHLRGIRRRFAVVLGERSRLAREMHDTLIQGCVGVSTLLEAASSLQHSSPASSRDLVERAREQVQLTIDEAREAVWKLRDQSGACENLTASLAQTAQRVSRETGILVNCSGSLPAGIVDPDVQHNLLLVAREAISNAVRHAAPTRISVDVAWRDALLQLEVADNGSGFTEHSVMEGSHYGVLGMRERVESLGGDFTINSSPGRGTVVRVTVPCGLKARNGETPEEHATAPSSRER